MMVYFWDNKSLNSLQKPEILNNWNHFGLVNPIFGESIEMYSRVMLKIFTNHKEKENTV